METEYKPNYVVHPGMILRDDLELMGMTQAELAKETGISKTIINGIIKGKRNLTAKYAVLLEKVIDEPAGFWLKLQSDYDETIARLELAATIDSDEFEDTKS